MAETERTLHDELVELLIEVYASEPDAHDLRTAARIIERHFRKKLLSDEAVEALSRVFEPVTWEGIGPTPPDRKSALRDARGALRAALDHVCRPEGGESRG
jgi:hypothetical protein